ncbi:MAG TPA: class I SAM-dependent methyltransferase [Candidatus Koribacter sp.]
MDRPNGSTYVGVFFLTLATITYEILITRIFSVQLYYHFAFVAISIAMFGMSVGAVAVYVLPRLFPPAKTMLQMAVSTGLFSWTIVLAYLIERKVPVGGNNWFGSYGSISLIYVVIAAPFIFSGVSVCLALTRFPKHVAKLYSVDLLGAALGCLCIIGLLRITDGPSAVAATAAIAAAAAFFFSLPQGLKLSGAAVLTFVGMIVLCVTSTLAARAGKPFMGIYYTKFRVEHEIQYEKWSHFSRITVAKSDFNLPFGWGMSPTWKYDRPVRPELTLAMDGLAATPIVQFDGDFDQVPELKYDIVNSVHYLRPDSDVLIVGTGGGRDVLSALAYKQKSIVGVEINQDILNTLNHNYGDFSGHLDRYPNVRFVNDEARSFVTRQNRRFDVIQVSLIDTFAASSAGAFVLTENSLYTTNGWKVFLSKLSDRGVLTFSRWYYPDRPAEVYRLTALATQSLLESGVTDPRSHIILLETPFRTSQGSDRSSGVGTILVSRNPFSAADLEKMQQLASTLQFNVLLSPVSSSDPMLEHIASGKDLQATADAYPLNIHPPTDDNPFFFNVMYLHSLFHPELIRQGSMSHNTWAVYVLAWLAVTVVVLTALCIVAPLLLTTERSRLRGTTPSFLYFGGIGLGFMLVEVSQMQRLVVFLGHPTYALAVALFSLLVFSGIGSLACSRIKGQKATGRLSLLLVALVLFGLLTVRVTTAYAASTTNVRIALAVALLAPLAFFMGMAFPLGMQWISEKSPEIGPWLWGVNGATSVCASVFAMVIAIAYGISASFWTGVACYAIAAVAYSYAHRPMGARHEVALTAKA